MNFIVFILKMTLVSVVLYSYYWFFLRNKKFHLYNRFYLLSIPLLSIFIPLLNVQMPGFYEANHGTGIKLLKAITISGWEDAVIITAQRNWLRSLLSLQNIAFVIYAIIALVIFYGLARSVFHIIHLSGKYNYEKINEIKFYQTPEPGTPFSFLNNIFWNNKIDMNSEAGSRIFLHELYHAKQKHTADILFTELLCGLFWFNPFFHLLKKELKAVHEFLADQYAASGTNSYDYAELLVLKSVANDQFNIANPFFSNQIKRRIAMITQPKNSRHSYIRRLMALPLLFILFCAFGLKLTQNAFPNSLHGYRPITIIIDAGHGGIDPGTISKNGILEKDIALAIAKKIQLLSKDYNVNVMMTREADILPGNASTIKEGLSNRVNIAGSNNAVLFISIHMDATINGEPKSGFSIYLSNRNLYYKKSMELGSILTEEIKETYTISPELKERQRGIMVLQSSSIPAVMIECGYITDKKDLAFITDEKNQEQIARDILQGVVKYSNEADNAFTNTSKYDSLVLPSEFAKIKPEDIENITLNKLNVIIKMKNGNTVTADKKETEKYFKKNNLDFNGYEINADAKIEKDDTVVEIKSLKKVNQDENKDTVPTKDHQQTFTKVEIEAEYPGGQNGWKEYLIKNTRYPEEAIKKNIQGAVIVQFIVKMDGTITDVKAVKSPNEILSQEAIRIIKNSGKWIPAMQNGKKVNAYKKQPLVFRLDSK